MSQILAAENKVFSDVDFADMWNLWLWKGHDPAQKLSFFEVKRGEEITFSVGILDYMTLENIIFPSEKSYKNNEQAFAAVGRALDKAEKVKSNG